MTAASIVINNFNYGAYLGRAIASGLEQDHPHVEVVVVDDGSSDDSRAVLEAHRQGIHVVYQDNKGQAGAINAGVAASSGDIICFLDADDWLAPGKVSAVVDAFASDPAAGLVYHRLQPVREDGRACLKPIPRTLCGGNLMPRLQRSAGWWPFPMTSAVAVRRTVWNRIGPIPEDFRISADAWLVGIYPFFGRVVSLPQVLGYYRLHGQNNWHRESESEEDLRRQMAHWRATVEASNQFLKSQGLDVTLRLGDHHPYRVASARLAALGARDRLRLALGALRFAGEPNPLRRTRDAIRILRLMPAACGGSAP